MAVQAQTDKQLTFSDDPSTAWKRAAQIIFNPLVGALIFLVFGAGVFFGGFTRTFGDITVDGVIREGFSNLGIELVSIALTVIVVDQLNRRRDERERKEELILQMGSLSNDFALEAARQFSNKSWLYDGSLQGANLSNANLQGASLNFAKLEGADLINAKLQDAGLFSANLTGTNLSNANLQSADLRGANLQNANLWNADLRDTDLRHADLQSADLWNAKLQGADLRGSNLSGANLSHAELEGADLEVANLRGADLVAANLQGANLSAAQFDETTTLPDFTQWTTGRDMRQFTDPDGWAAGKYKIASPGADAPPSP